MLTATELKEKLIAQINSTEDVELLHQIELLIKFETGPVEIYDMGPEEEAAVKIGLDQLNRGEYISNAESNKRAEEWLKKFAGQ